MMNSTDIAECNETETDDVRSLGLHRIMFWLSRDDGAGLAEYALLLLLIAVACVTALTTLGGTISAAYNTANGMFN